MGKNTGAGPWVRLSLWGIVLVEAVGLGFGFYDFADFYDGAHCLFHCLNGNVFVAAVHVHATCEDVGAWQTFKRELCAVGSAADRLNDRGDIGVFHCLFCHLDDVHHGFNLFAHVVVLVFDFD